MLNRYVDGQLAVERQATLFEHLAGCASCRQQLEAVLTFRRMSRQERLAVPPAADETFLERLSQRRQADRDSASRTTDRKPLWLWQAPVSLRAAAAALMLVFMVGLLLPTNISQSVPSQIEPAPQPEAVFIFYPGLTVKASDGEELPATDPF